MEEPKEVFISYKWEQIAIDFVAVLNHELDVNGFSVWLDSDGGIKPGSYIAAEICNGLDECKTFIPVVTKKYCDSKWCMDELHHVNHSNKQQKKLIIAVILEDIPFATEGEKAFHLMMDSICWIKCKPGDDYTKCISEIITTLKGLRKGIPDHGEAEGIIVPGESDALPAQHGVSHPDQIKRAPPRPDQSPTLTQLQSITVNGEVVSIIRDVAPNWKNLCVAFNFDRTGHQLKVIEQRYPNQAEECCLLMFQTWLNKPGASWRSLISALEASNEALLAVHVKTYVGI